MLSTAPTAAQTLTLQALANQNASGTLTNDQALASTVDLASDATTAVSVGTYEFFLGFAPSEAGSDQPEHRLCHRRRASRPEWRKPFHRPGGVAGSHLGQDRVHQLVRFAERG
ncbi:hypothetical protein ACRAWD_03330 [Caulobacter segnis]